MSTDAVKNSEERLRGRPPENPWQMANRGKRRSGRNEQNTSTDRTETNSGSRGTDVGPTVDGLGAEAPTFESNAGIPDDANEMDVECVQVENIAAPEPEDPDAIPIRVEFKMPKNTSNAFNIITARANFIRILKTADPKLMILTKKLPITNLRSFPESKNTYNDDFDWFSDS